MKRIVPLIAPPFESYDPETFVAYAKSLEKPWKPKAAKKVTKTRKKKSDDCNPRLESDTKDAGSETDAGNVSDAGRTDSGGNKFLLAISYK